MTNETEAGTPIADSLRDHGSKYYNHERYDEKLIKAIEKLERDLNAANAKAERYRVALEKIMFSPASRDRAPLIKIAREALEAK